MRLVVNAACVAWFMVSLLGVLRSRSKAGRVCWFVSAGMAYCGVAVIGV